MHFVYQGCHGLDRRAGPDAVAQIEDVSGARGGLWAGGLMYNAGFALAQTLKR